MQSIFILAFFFFEENVESIRLLKVKLFPVDGNDTTLQLLRCLKFICLFQITQWWATPHLKAVSHPHQQSPNSFSTRFSLNSIRSSLKTNQWLLLTLGIKPNVLPQASPGNDLDFPSTSFTACLYQPTYSGHSMGLPVVPSVVSSFPA
jgi:hypothetical protein